MRDMCDYWKFSESSFNDPAIYCIFFSGVNEFAAVLAKFNDNETNPGTCDTVKSSLEGSER